MKRNLVILEEVLRGSSFKATGDNHGITSERARVVANWALRKILAENGVEITNIIPDLCSRKIIRIAEMREHAQFFLAQIEAWKRGHQK